MHHLKLPCDANPACLHPACHHCDRPLFHSKQRKKNHPGTIFGVWRDLLCNRCKLYGREPYQQPEPEPEPEMLPDVIEDQRHQLLSDEELAHVYEVDSHMYDWHLARRKRLKLRLPELNTNMCQVEGCDSDTRSRGLCAKHYHRWRRHGDPTFTMRKMSS